MKVINNMSKKIITINKKDINRVLKVYDAMGMMEEISSIFQFNLQDLEGYQENYPFNTSLTFIRNNIEQSLKRLYGEITNNTPNTQSDNNNFGFEISPYRYHLPADRLHAQYTIIRFIWQIYEQYLLATIHEGTAELFILCDLNPSKDNLDLILKWHRAVALKNGLPNQSTKGTRIRPRKKWSKQARQRHSKRMKAIKRSKGQ